MKRLLTLMQQSIPRPFETMRLYRRALAYRQIRFATFLMGVLAVFSVAASAAELGVAVPPPGSVFAQWSYTHEQLEAMVPRARPEDVATPEAIVRALHESVNGPKGPWNSDRFRSLYLPNALLADVTKNKQGAVMIGNHPLVSLLKDVQDVHDTSGWYETVTKIIQISKTEKHGGGLAVVYYHGVASTTPGGKAKEDGDSMAILMCDGKRWWVVSDTW
ncbi:hypothetical protein [Tunturiibacter gelidoferens]|uniref:Nuclear transport factor 2 family protein n=1 Tax=Tunturiibacter gelidiferens TaxID=3069689 RepID=A0A9X0U587_9BACT|nr:hypothetical protein [Edaphobacter lichenicola]MBB5330291.1 hypothetical protein [Edaphobacter lichenicola]